MHLTRILLDEISYAKVVTRSVLICSSLMGNHFPHNYRSNVGIFNTIQTSIYSYSIFFTKSSLQVSIVI